MSGVGAANRRPPSPGAVSTSGSIAAATLTGTSARPTGTRTGDLLLTTVGLLSATDTIATPTGWVKIGDETSTGAGTNFRAYLFSRSADLGADDVPTWTKTGAGGTWRITVLRVSNCLGVDAATGNHLAAAADVTPIAPTVSPTVLFDTWLTILVNRTTNTVTAPARFVLVSQIGTAPASAILRRGPLNATGATGTQAFTLNGAAKWVAFSVAVKHV